MLKNEIHFGLSSMWTISSELEGIARRITGHMGWRSCELLKPANEGIGVKPTLNAGISRLQPWRSSQVRSIYEIAEGVNRESTPRCQARR
ncbi:hypothetical protein KEJ27_06610 [Candidatus Bathyarchaeota archaeon]|nr:hypothetical protein [Candidatus Bathyarchaeota archaeon]